MSVNTDIVPRYEADNKYKDEIWKTINRFPRYEVSNYTRIRNKETGIFVTPFESKIGYWHVGLYREDGRKNVYVHRIVAEAFVDGYDEDLVVNHIDGNKSNNFPDNLEWCTASENVKHAFEIGLKQPVKHPKARPVRIVETGEVFESARKCASVTNSAKKNILRCMDGKQETYKDLHFESIDKEEYEKIHKPKRKVREPFLYDYQMEAVMKLRNGNILCGSVGCGKSICGLFYYFKEQGGWIDEYGYVPMKKPKDLYIVTTAKKRDSLDWEGELARFLLSTNPEHNKTYGNKIVVDSWNNLPKYKDVEGAFFILDEQRLVSYGAWTKAFLKIAKSNDFIMLTGTPGDSYIEYLPMFLANGFFKNKTEFNTEHVIYSRFAKFPKIDGYRNTTRLDRLRDKILVEINYKHAINAHHEDCYCDYNLQLYKDTIRKRWDPYKDEPIEQASGLCYVLRRIVNSDESRQAKLLEILEDHPRALIFYNFTYELEILRNLAYGEGVAVAEYNGQKHQDIPKTEKWVYLCQYTACAEGWQCIETNCTIFYSQNYSYKILTQSDGRIDRCTTPFTDLYYYHLRSRSGIDLAIHKALKNKKKFNERKWTKWDNQPK